MKTERDLDFSSNVFARIITIDSIVATEKEIYAEGTEREKKKTALRERPKRDKQTVGLLVKIVLDRRIQFENLYEQSEQCGASK